MKKKTKILKIIHKIIIGFFPDARTRVFSIFIGISTGAVIYLGLLQRHFFSWRYLLYFFLVSVAAVFLAAWVYQRFILPKYLDIPNKLKVFVWVFSLILALILLLNVEIQPIYYILPDRHLEIDFQIDALPPGEEGVRLLWIETGQGYVHYTKMGVDGEWERVFGNTVFPPGQSVKIRWQGKVGKKSDITFRSTNFEQIVNISWDGKETAYQLQNSDNPTITINHYFKIPLLHQLPFIVSFLISVTFGLSSLIFILAYWNPVRKKKPRKKAKNSWLLFMLPMLIVWGFTLLVFWPGIISNDSIFQMRQG